MDHWRFERDHNDPPKKIRNKKSIDDLHHHPTKKWKTFSEDGRTDTHTASPKTPFKKRGGRELAGDAPPSTFSTDLLVPPFRHAFEPHYFENAECYRELKKLASSLSYTLGLNIWREQTAVIKYRGHVCASETIFPLDWIFFFFTSVSFSQATP